MPAVQTALDRTSSCQGSGARILVFADARTRAELQRGLTQRGYSVVGTGDAEQTRRYLQSEYYDGMIVDLAAPGLGGWDVLDMLADLKEHPITLAIIASEEIGRASDAMRRGACDVLEKPCGEVEVASRLQTALEGAQSDQRIATTGAIVVSEAMRKVFSLAERVARTPASSALITGESGAGKEIVATRIHEFSDRRNKPFVRVNLAAFPESMVEAELFGAARGAFTDSKKERHGLLASADGGTLLLDEITEFRIDLQPKLLRVLEERRYFQLGTDQERSVDLRIIGATNRNPLEAIGDGHLRNDLYFRLATVIIEVPPLRKRTDDLIPLATHFLAWFASEFKRATPALSEEAERALIAHRWPGNVRELRNVIERAVIMTEGPVVDVAALALPPASVEIRGNISPLLVPPPAPPIATNPTSAESVVTIPRAPAALGHRSDTAPPRPVPSRPAPVRKISRPSMIAFRASKLPLKLDLARAQTLEAVERRQIQRALELASGSKSAAATMLGISRTTLWEKMKLYELN